MRTLIALHRGRKRKVSNLHPVGRVNIFGSQNSVNVREK